MGSRLIRPIVFLNSQPTFLRFLRDKLDDRYPIVGSPGRRQCGCRGIGFLLHVCILFYLTSRPRVRPVNTPQSCTVGLEYIVIGDRGVERIEDDNIGPLWAEHYPKRKDEPASQVICLSLLAIVMRKAIMTIPYGNRYEKLILALAEFGIPENQFWELDNEIKTM